MKFFKSKYKHLLSFLITVLILIAFNLNVFAASSFTCDLNTGTYKAYKTDVTSENNNVTNQVGRGRISAGPSDDKRSCTAFAFPSSLASYRKILLISSDVPLYPGYEYIVSGSVYVSSSASTTVDVSFISSISPNNNDEGLFLTLYNGSVNNSKWVDFRYNLVLPDTVQSDYNSYISIILSQNPTVLITTYFYFTDIKFEINDPLYGDHYSEPDLSEAEEQLSEYDDVMNELPTIDQSQIDDLMDFDFSGFSNSLSFIRSTFDELTSISQISAVLIFALTIGLATYILGRRLG